jgi:methionyl-tRNA formyltransferase
VKIIFAGTPQFAALALEALHREHQIVAVLTQPDRPSGRGMQLAHSPVKQFALSQGLLVLQPATLKIEPAQQVVAALDAEVMVVAAYGLILPKAVLDMPRYGCLNIHASLLPRWRGAAPIQRAIQAGDAETGITIMQMDEGLDTGDMLLRRACPIAVGDTAAVLHDKLAMLGADSIIKALRLLQAGQLQPVRQNNAEACYAPKLLKSEAVIDWRLDARVIERTVRAFNPFPVCQSAFRGVTIKIWQASLIDMNGAPGTVLVADKRGIVVACGDGALCLEILQRPGGKAQTAAHFMQAVPVQPGDIFDAG